MGKEDCSRFKDCITDAVEYHGKQWMTISEFLTALIGGKEAKEILGYFAETTRMLINKV